MKLLSHFPDIGVSNTYVIGPQDGGDAILVDPGRFNVTLLELIENAGFYIKAVLATHHHDNHVKGLNTLLKIYDAEVYAGDPQLLGYPSNYVKNNTTIKIVNMEVGVLDVVGHTTDSRVYMIGPYLFTGDILSAGRVSTTMTPSARNHMISSIQDGILTIQKDLLILPGHGPPTTINAEKRWNPNLNSKA